MVRSDCKHYTVKKPRGTNKQLALATPTVLYTCTHHSHSSSTTQPQSGASSSECACQPTVHDDGPCTSRRALEEYTGGYWPKRTTNGENAFVDELARARQTVRRRRGYRSRLPSDGHKGHMTDRRKTHTNQQRAEHTHRTLAYSRMDDAPIVSFLQNATAHRCAYEPQPIYRQMCRSLLFAYRYHT